MQNDAVYSTAHGGLATSSRPPSPLNSQNRSGDAVFASLYNSIFDRNRTLTRYGVESDSEHNRRLYHSLLVQDHQEMVNRHSRCLKRLHQTSEEADALRRENTQLRALNLELNKHLSLLIHASVQKQFASPSSVQKTPLGIVNRLGAMSIHDKRAAEEDVSDESPISVVENDGADAENVEMERFSLPKSISVRSDGYVKVPPPAAGASTAAKTQTATQPRTATAFNASQKVYVPAGGMKEEKPLELEVYNQGMFKTELCNKWQEVGECPYGDHCQFAHGIEEMRPVIRHPRYKTEVCRMVLAGDPCPYGHRCHFRHALTENEKMMLPNKATRPFKLHR